MTEYAERDPEQLDKDGRLLPTDTIMVSKKALRAIAAELREGEG